VTSIRRVYLRGPEIDANFVVCRHRFKMYFASIELASITVETQTRPRLRKMANRDLRPQSGKTMLIGNAHLEL
jgi:hypothetical protein